MGASDAMKFRIGNLCRSLQRAENDSPTHLHGPRVALGKGFSGEVRSCNRELLAGQAAQIIGKDPNFLQFRCSSSNRFPDVCKPEELGFMIRRGFIAMFRAARIMKGVSRKL